MTRCSTLQEPGIGGQVGTHDNTVVDNIDLWVGSGDWLVGARFPIGYYSDSVILAPLQGDQILVLPDQVFLPCYEV